MRLLLTGANGQLGRELRPLLQQRGDLLCTTRDGEGGDAALDLGRPDTVAPLLEDFRPDLVFNAAAYTAVDRAESEPERAFRVNAESPGVMAGWAAAHGAALVHFSTDYVFDGRKASPYLEPDPVAPLNVYGESKLEGERAVAASACRSVVLRTSWVYASHGRNFVLRMLELARERDTLDVVSDQVGRPTWAANLARYALAAVDAGVPDDPDPKDRLLHAADAGACSWFEFSRLIFDTAQSLGLLTDVPRLREVGSDAFPTLARRPASSVLGTGRLRHRVGLEPVAVKASLAQCLGELKRHD